LKIVCFQLVDGTSSDYQTGQNFKRLVLVKTIASKNDMASKETGNIILIYKSLIKQKIKKGIYNKFINRK
jgi:hypothetical protein